MDIDSPPGPPRQRSHLFVVRFWQEDMGNGQMGWRAKLQHVATGEVRYFRDWLGLKEFMEGNLHSGDMEELHLRE